ncbi:MAG: phosphoribosylamine--glycine ligase [Candidatus Moranbacteria bacterium]|nr:phosphoribosylamine--glycine ligase [Candidatus Moranbacteria bacterium]
MRLLVFGSGGREHALAWKLAKSPRVEIVFVAPGNAATAHGSKMQNVPLTDIAALEEFAVHEKIDFTVIGPEGPLAAGAVDAFHARGLKILGPTQRAAQLESSKDFAKEFMRRHGIPTSPHKTFSDPALAHAYVEEHGVPIVIKADGLAAGKGVEVATNLAQAHAAVDTILVKKKFEGACDKVVIEDFADGEEASFIVVADGKHVLPLATSQDHKRRGDGDTGPNTGGAGVYSPAYLVTPELHECLMDIAKKTIDGMAEEGMPFVGFLYIGVMIRPDGSIAVLEFNVRLGDPETQPIMMRLLTDLVEISEHALAGTLDKVEAQWDSRAAIGVVLMDEGYPENPKKGAVITGLPEETDDCVVFQAGTLEVPRDSGGSEIVVHGGRVLCVTTLGKSLRSAQQRAYKVADDIQFERKYMRRDIGYRALARMETAVVP